MRAHFGLPSVEGEVIEGKPPIQVKFEIPYFTTSGIQVGYKSFFLFPSPFQADLIECKLFEWIQNSKLDCPPLNRFLVKMTKKVRQPVGYEPANLSAKVPQHAT